MACFPNHVQWHFTTTTEGYFVLTVLNLVPEEMLTINTLVQESCKDIRINVAAKFTENTLEIRHHYNDIKDTNWCGLTIWANKCCRAVGHVIHKRDPAIAVPSAAVDYEVHQKLARPSSAMTEDSSTTSSSARVQNEKEYIHPAKFSMLNDALFRQLQLWCEVGRTKRELQDWQYANDV